MGLEIIGPDKVTFIACAVKIQLPFLTHFSKRGMFLAPHHKDCRVPYLTGQDAGFVAAAGLQVVKHTAQCAIVFSAHKGALFQALQPVPCQGGGVSGSSQCLLVA